MMNEINEGIWDRAKAQVAGVAGTVKGLGDRAVGSAVQGYGSITKNTAAKQAGQSLVQRGRASGEIAKIESYRNTAKQKIQKLSEEIFSDLKKLGIDLKGLNPNIANSFVGSLNKGFDTLVGSLNSFSPSSSSTSKSLAPSPTASTATPSTLSSTTSASTPMKVAPRGERAALDTLTKEKDSMLNDPNSLIGIAKYVAGTSGIGSGKPKDGVALLSNTSVLNDPSKVKPEDKAKIDASLKQLATKLKVDQKRLVGLLGKVFTESNTKSFKLFFRSQKL